MKPDESTIFWHEGLITRTLRWKKLGCKGGTVWFTGLPAAGKNTIASALELALIFRGVYAYRLDGDNIRHGLNTDLGLSRTDRAENIRRIGEVSALFADGGFIALTTCISPYIKDRERVRLIHSTAHLPFLEVFVDAPLEVCEARDPSGQYGRARRGLIKGFTGGDNPYEPPPAPDLILKTAEKDVSECVAATLGLLIANRLVHID